MAVMEICRFRLAGDDGEFLRADYRMQTEFVPNRPGFARRTTATSGDGEWVTVSLWGSAEEADAAYADLTGGDDEVGAAYLALIDRSTFERRCYALLD